MDGEVDDVGDTEVQDRVDDGTFVDYDAASPETSHSVPSVVKMRLNTFVHGKDDVAGRADAAAAARLKCKLGLLVMEGNILLGEAYAFANYHVLRLLNCNKQVPVIDRNFFYRCLLAVSISASRVGTLGTEFEDSVLMFDALRDATPAPTPQVQTPQTTKKGRATKPSRTYNSNPLGKHKVDITTGGYNQLIADLSIQMATMATNHLWTNLESRINRFLGWAHPTIRRFHKAIVRALVIAPNEEVVKIMEAAAAFKTPKKPRRNAPRKVKPNPTTAPTSTGADAKRAKEDAKRAKEDAKRAKEDAQRAEAISVANKLRGLINLPNKSKFASRAHLTLPLYHYLLHATEEGLAASKLLDTEGTQQKRFPGRLFSLLPMKGGFTTSYIPISSMFLMSVLRYTQLEPMTDDGRSLDHRALWKKYFNLELVETRRRIFDNRIMTDGYAVSVLISSRVNQDTSKGSSDSSLERIQQLVKRVGADNVVTCGVDPGFTDIVTVSFSDKKDAVHYSSAQYYERAKIKYSSRRTQAYNLETKQETDFVYSSPTTCRTTDQKEMETYLRGYLTKLRLLLQHRYTQQYRKLRFLRHIQKQTTVREIVDIIVGTGPNVPQLTVVGFGDWSGGHKSSVSRQHSGPIQTIKDKIGRRRKAAIKPVDEYLTSQKDSRTHNTLINMKAKTTTRANDGTLVVRQKSKVHKVLHCQPSDASRAEAGTETTWNRDVNASRNILMLLQHEIEGRERPQAFRRGKNKVEERHIPGETTSNDVADEPGCRVIRLTPQGTT
jgi:hypothetical protein